MAAFEARLRASLKEHVVGITIGHVTHVKQVLDLRDEITVQVDVEMGGATNV